jgi:hypothetical protein
MVNQNQVTAGGGGFLRVLGIIYLVKMIRQRRRARSQQAADSQADERWRDEGSVGQDS